MFWIIGYTICYKTESFGVRSIFNLYRSEGVVEEEKSKTGKFSYIVPNKKLKQFFKFPTEQMCIVQVK